MADRMDFDILPELVGYHLRKAQVAVFSHFSQAVNDLHVTPGQFGTLCVIAANEGLTQSALAKAVGIERSTMVAVIDALEGHGWVRRQPSPTDRRSNALALTERGHALLQELRTRVRVHEDKVLRDLSDAEKETLIAMLRRIHERA